MTGLVEYDLGNGRKVYRVPKAVEPSKRSDLPCPRIVRPFSEPVRSMADGKLYTDAASLRSSYKAENNPHGVNFTEVGDEDLSKFDPPKRDRRANRDAIERALSDVENGRAPPVLTEAP